MNKLTNIVVVLFLVSMALVCPLKAANDDSNNLLPAENMIVFHNAIKSVYDADIAADNAWCACTNLDMLCTYQQKVRESLVKSLGGFPERCALNLVCTGKETFDGFTVEKIMFESRPRMHVTAHLFLPDVTRFPGCRPGILIPCGHSNNGKCSKSYQRGALQAAKFGMVALVYDPIDQGERRQCRGDAKLWSCSAHNNIGRRAELLGWSTASFRTWDAMRAIDVLISRPEVDPERIGVMGHSGGGTMTSWVMALDNRVKCAAPSGYLSTVRSVCEQCGPQDAEQFVFGELKFGFNHLGHILLRAPSPVMLCSSHGDFFPFSGVMETSTRAASVYARIGAGNSFRLFDTLGPHHWHESTRTAAVAWMNHVLQGGVEPDSAQAYRDLQWGFSYAKVDCALGYEARNAAEERANVASSVTSTGCTLDLPGERTAYDVMSDEANRLMKARSPLTPLAVRHKAGIRAQTEINYSVHDARKLVNGESVVLVADDGTPVPLTISGKGEKLTLVIADDFSRKELMPWIAKSVSEDHRVGTADVRGFGETSRFLHKFYSTEGGDEELARLYALLGVNLVAKRAEDIIAVAKYFGGGKPVELVAKGYASVAAAHAYYTARELFSSITLENQPVAWRVLFDNDAITYRFAETVYDAWRLYDWVDLVK